MLRHEPATSDSDVDIYSKRFQTLLRLAEQFNISSDDAEELVTNVLLSSLYSRTINDIDTWLTGALTHAVRRLP